MLAGGAATAGQSGKAAAGAPAAGTVTGTLTVGTTPVTLTHAYVALDGDNYIVELTDQALPAASLAAELKFGGGQGLLRSGKAQGLMLYVDGKGFVVTAIPFAGDYRGNKMLSSVGSLVSFKVAAGQASGTGKLSLEDTNQGWSYQAQFTAPVRAVK
ncbi:MAG: hypothetical protein ABIT71_17925 [Vicinamibacteraceae bacterium]